MLHQEIVTDALTGAQFNDYEKLDATLMGLETKGDVPEYSTQVCRQHAKQYKMADGLEEGVGSGTCGVVGCDKEAAHYYYFKMPKGSNPVAPSVATELESEPYSELPLITPTIPSVARTTKKKRRNSMEPGVGISGVVQ